MVNNNREMLDIPGWLTSWQNITQQIYNRFDIKNLYQKNGIANEYGYICIYNQCKLVIIGHTTDAY